MIGNRSLLNRAQIKRYIRAKYNRRVGRAFLDAVNTWLYMRLDQAATIRFAGKITMDGDLANWVGFRQGPISEKAARSAAKQNKTTRRQIVYGVTGSF